MDYLAELTQRFSEIPEKPAEDRRASLLKAAKSFFTDNKADLHRMHFDGAGGAAIVSGYTSLADALVRSIYAAESATVSTGVRHALLALGGYGREELCFCSDLDIAFVYEGRIDKGLEALNDSLLHLLWDLGFMIGHGIRSIEDSLSLASRDAIAQTSMLESRPLAGDDSTCEKFIGEIFAQVRSPDPRRFARRIGKERERRLREAGDEVYRPAPNIKQGAGGLRDYHSGVWIALARFGFKSPRELFDAELLTEEQFFGLERALDFIWRVRNQAYLDGESPEDVLTQSRQERIAGAFGYRDSRGALAVELFMQDYYVHASQLRAFCEEMLRLGGLPEKRRAGPSVPRGGKTERGLRIAHRRVYLPARDANWLRRNPSRLLEIVWYSQKQGFTISRTARKTIGANLDLIDGQFRRDPVARNFFLAILSDPLRAGANVRLMDDLGILDCYLPEFAAVRNIIRYHHFHQHPVNEHTLRALENISSIPHTNEAGSNALKKALSEIKDPAIFSLAVILHDLGKAEGEEHVEAGVRTAETVGRRLALNAERIDTLEFLVRNHILMTRLCRYRDLDDPETIRSFASSVGSIENLNMLYLLTYADLKAVRQGAWSDWISALLYRLYGGARDILAGPSGVGAEDLGRWETPKAAAVAEYLKSKDSSEVREHLRGMPPRYLAFFSPKEIAEHLRMASSLRTHKSALKWTPVPEYSLSQITVCTGDAPGLFAKIVGAFASQQVSVLDAAVFTRADGVAIDSFYVIDGKTEGPLTSTKWAVVKDILGKVLRGERKVERLIRRVERSPVAARKAMSSLRRGVSFDNAASMRYTIIDVEAPDRIGLLYDIASALYHLELDISVARITTDERRARDAFYVSDLEGGKIVDPLRLEEIRTRIEEVLNTSFRDPSPAGNKRDKHPTRADQSSKKRRVKK